MSMLKRLFRADKVAEKGQVIVLMGLTVVVLFGISGLAIDVGRLYKTKAELMRSSDAAALAGVLEMNGTAAGLTAAENKAEAYFDLNEPGTGVTRDAVANGSLNELTVTASKSVDMIFLGVFGVGSATVNARAKAGFGNLTIDAAIAIDSTSSMGDSPCNGSQNNTGCPIWEAKNAAKAFKDILLGTAPSGNVAVGVASWRGCYRRGTPTATAPMANTNTNCVLHDTSGSSQVSTLISNPTTLGTMIDNISAIGGSGTNVCNGVAKAWEVLEGTGNHLTAENNRRYLIVLSDGDNNYTGSYTYQASFPSPHTYQTHPCQPPSSCSNVGGEGTSGNALCQDGIYTALTTTATDSFATTVTTLATESFPSSGCTTYTWGASSGTPGWTGAWVRDTTPANDVPATVTSPAQDTSCSLRLRGTGWVYRNVNLTSVTSAELVYYARHTAWVPGDGNAGFAEASTSTAGPWTTLVTHTTGNTNTGFQQYTADLTAFAGQTNVYIRFISNTGTSTTKLFHVDAITVRGCTNSFSSGSGWLANWTRTPTSGNDAPIVTHLSTPVQSATCHARIRGVGAMYRTVNLASSNGASLSYYARQVSMASGDTVVVEAATSLAGPWTTIQTHTSSNTSGTYASFGTSGSGNLSAFDGQSTVYLRFRGGMPANNTTKQFFFDTIAVTSGASGSSDGYLNGGSPNFNCDQAPGKRERQMDIRTIEMAQAAKADGVEIYTVAFGVCATNATVYTAAQCQPFTTTGGQIGNTDVDNTGDQRLMKCIASSDPTTNNHYFYASSAAALPTIFTTIAQQIAHRLVE